MIPHRFLWSKRRTCGFHTCLLFPRFVNVYIEKDRIFVASELKNPWSLPGRPASYLKTYYRFTSISSSSLFCLIRMEQEDNYDCKYQSPDPEPFHGRSASHKALSPVQQHMRYVPRSLSTQDTPRSVGNISDMTNPGVENAMKNPVITHNWEKSYWSKS
jgi:hypothetical protein